MVNECKSRIIKELEVAGNHVPVQGLQATVGRIGEIPGTIGIGTDQS